MKINKALMSGVDIGEREMSVCGEIENMQHENRMLNEEYVKIVGRQRQIQELIKINNDKIKMLEDL
tara:strand:- start:495 stop:692 length:198 start_codon:yes stop_codon:yes gene_type:complete